MGQRFPFSVFGGGAAIASAIARAFTGDTTVRGTVPAGATATCKKNGTVLGAATVTPQGAASYVLGSALVAGDSVSFPWTLTGETPAATVTNAPAPLSISGVPGAASVGTAYSFVPAVSGGSGAKTFSLTGTLPAGLSFSSSTGAITGTPTTAGTTSGLAIGVTDASGSATLSGLSIVVGVVTGITGVNGLICAGDSLTSCEIPNAVSYPTQIQRQTTKRVLNKGRPGYRVDQLDASFYTTDVGNNYSASLYNLLVFLAGTNDVIQGAAFATIRDRLIAYWQKAKATGYKLVVCTLPAQGNLNATQIGVQQALNDWIKANWQTYADAMVDLSAVTELSDPNNTTYFRADKLHFTTAGSTAQMNAIFAKLGLPVEMGTLGTELIPDGDFASGAGAWTSTGTGWTFGSGVATKTAGNSGNLVRNLGTTLPAGTRVLLRYDYTAFTAEYAFAYVNGHAEPNKANVGSYTECWISDGTINSVQFWPSAGAALVVDNVSFRVIGP